MTILIAAIVAAVVAWIVCRYLASHDGGTPTPQPPPAKVGYASIFVAPTADPTTPIVVKVAPERLTLRAGDFVDWSVVDLARANASLAIRFLEGDPLEAPTGEFRTSVRRRVRDVSEHPDFAKQRQQHRGDGPRVAVFPYQVFINGQPGVDPEIQIEY